MARPPSTVSSEPAVAAITAKTATVIETLETNGSRACAACSACSCASRAGSCDMALFQQAEINGIGHRLIARIIGVKLVAEVEVGAESEWIGRIGGGGGEVHHAIKGAAAPDPVVEPGAYLFPGRRGVGSTLIGRQNGADHLYAMGVAALDDLFVGGDQCFQGYGVLRPLGGEPPTDVVDPFQQNDGSD